jgi:hypothetical protein
MKMKNGHKIVLEWVTETDEALEKFKRNAELQAKLWANIIKEENDDTKMV